MPEAGEMWDPWSVDEVVLLFRGAPVPWWLSGGWALDEYLGRVSRPHGDIDVTVARADWPAFFAFIGQRLDVHIARDGALYSAAKTPLLETDHNIWVRLPGEEAWRVQINLEPITSDLWSYRRDPRITRPVSEACWWSGRVTCISPAIQLLWKSGGPRTHDEEDYLLVRPALPPAEQRWLRDAVRLAHPSSPWVADD